MIVTTVDAGTGLAALLDDDIALASAIAGAELPALLPALAHLTGDMSLVADELRPPLRLRPDLVEPQGGMSEEAQELGRRRALAALQAFRDRGAVPAPDPDDAEATAAGAEAVDVVLAVLRGYGLESDDARRDAR